MGFVGNFQRLKNAWASVDLVKEVSAIAADNEKAIADYNREQLFKQGEDSDGRKLRKYRRPRYARVKHEMNPLPGLGNPDLFVTGDFHRSIFTDVRGPRIIFDAKDWKVEKLAGQYGESIFGLHDDSRRRVWVEVLRPPLLPRINTITGSNLQ